MILNKEQVDIFTEKECQTHLKKLAKAYPLESPITDKLWPQIDLIVNSFLYLEDRIKSLDISEKLSKANDARWGRVAELPQAD